MGPRRFAVLAVVTLVVVGGVAVWPAFAQEVSGIVRVIDPARQRIILQDENTLKDVTVRVNDATSLKDEGGNNIALKKIKVGDRATVSSTLLASRIDLQRPVPEAKQPTAEPRSMLADFWDNFRHNLFKPLLLFFYLGFLVPILRVKFEFPYVIYQGLTIYLLIAIGWHGGEQLAKLGWGDLTSAAGFMLVGFVTNTLIGILAYLILRATTRMRRIDQATVAGYYGSDSAGTFVTCQGVLVSAHIAFQPYMPVMLAIMEIPGCLVALYLVSRLRHHGMDPMGNMPDEPGYSDRSIPPLVDIADSHPHSSAVEAEKELSLEKMEHPENENGNGNGNGRKASLISGKLLHEVFLNSGLYLLFGGILIGFISGLQGDDVTRADDNFFVNLFQGILCLFLLEMGMTASRKLRDLKTAGWPFILYGLIAPNIFAVTGILVAHAYATITHSRFDLGTYVLFSVLCAAASYIAVPAVQRLAIPEASPTLPLAASLGLTFSYNVTIGIPVYIEVAKLISGAR